VPVHAWLKKQCEAIGQHETSPLKE